MKYNCAALGGTFDRFHKGHQQLIDTAFSVADHCVIGITHSDLTKGKQWSQLVQSYAKRRQQVIDYCASIGKAANATIVELHDAYGPTLTDPTIDVIVVSTQTHGGAEAINQRRLELGLPELPVVETAMIVNNAGEHLSSTQIRSGKSSRNGQLYEQLFNQTIKFDKATLNALSSMQGELISETTISHEWLQQFTRIGIAGDMVTQFFVEHQLPFDCALIDGHTHREISVPLPPIGDMERVINPAGTINHDAALRIHGVIQNHQKNQIIMIDGEEDLLAFVLCLQFPLNSAVFYGQPGKGIVMIKLTEATRLRLAQYIDPTFI
jgi:pantetheine-phosphate adenylyltransferase